MARDKHKSPAEVTFRKQFEPAHPAQQSCPAFLLYACNLKPLSGSQLEVDTQVEGVSGWVQCSSCDEGIQGCANKISKCCKTRAKAAAFEMKQINK